MSEKNNVSKKTGRPPLPDLTEEQKEKALEMAEAGHSTKEIQDELLISSSWFNRYRRKDPIFREKYEQARLDSCEGMEDEIKTAHDDYVDPQRAKLKADNYKWLLSKKKPQVYGDRVDINMTQSIDISGALKEARERAVIDVGIQRLTGNTDTEKDPK